MGRRLGVSAALDVHRTKVFGRCAPTTGIEPFERLVEQVMSQPPYNTARRVFWVLSNGWTMDWLSPPFHTSNARLRHSAGAAAGRFAGLLVNIR